MRLDPFLVMLLAAAGLGGFLPATGEGLEVVKVAAMVTIGLLFFLWTLRSGQYEDLDGAANRILFDDLQRKDPSA